jgi:hypothetical protein
MSLGKLSLSYFSKLKDVFCAFLAENKFVSALILFIRARLVAVAMTVLFVIPVNVVSAAPANTGGTDYDIPISELNKVKKKTPLKRVTNESIKKKSAAKPQESSSKITVPVEPAAQGGTVHQKNPVVSEPLPENIQIHHAPYSFVVAGKRTVIYAVIDSKADIKEVNCSFHVAEGGVQTLVKMVKVNGTQFTYTAVLPGLTPKSPSLRYTIVAVDTLGKENRSREFVTPVMSSLVVPSWQLENANETIYVEQEDEKKLRKSPADPGILQ